MLLLLFSTKDKNKSDMYENKEWTWREKWFGGTRDKSYMRIITSCCCLQLRLKTNQTCMRMMGERGAKSDFWVRQTINHASWEHETGNFRCERQTLQNAITFFAAKDKRCKMRSRFSWRKTNLLLVFFCFFFKSWHFSAWNKTNLKSICLFGIQIVREYSCRFLKIACNSEDHYRAVYCYYCRVITLSLNVQHGYIAAINGEKKTFSPNPILNKALQRNVVWVSLNCSPRELFKFNILLT